MAKKTNLMYPTMRKNLETLGEQIKLARLRRDLTTKVVCERAGISRSTLWQIEKGNSTISIGSYCAVLHALGGLDKDLLLIAREDEVGHYYEDTKLLNKWKRS